MNISTNSEIIKKPCITVDDSKTDEKERMKALILQCYNRRFELVKFEPRLNEIKEYIDSVKNDAKENRQQTKSIISLSGRKLTMDQIHKATDPNRLF